jgi:hypothetical protein
MSNAISFRIPCTFDSHLLPAQFRDIGHWFLDLLHRQTLRWEFDKRGFVPLKYDYLTRVIPRARWPPLRDLLEATGVLRCDHSAINGVKAFGYRLNEFGTVPVPCRDTRLASKIRRLRAARRARLQPVHLHLEHWRQRLEFDTDAALAIVDTLAPDPDSPLSVSEYRALLRESCLRFNDRRTVTVDDYGRAHSAVTNLPKELRA